MLRLAALLVVLLAAPAAAADPRAELDRCAGGPLAEDRRATYDASMSARPGAEVLELRFTLQRATPLGWRRVHAPGFERPERSRPGAAALRFEKGVTGLWGPGRFRARVRFAWLGADGRVVARATRSTGACALADWRPALRTTAIAATTRPGGLADYEVTVRNDGRGAVEAPFDVVLGLAGANRPPARVPSLAPGAQATVVVTAPACRPGEVVRATADAARVVPQARRADDVLDVGCPLHSSEP